MICFMPCGCVVEVDTVQILSGHIDPYAVPIRIAYCERHGGSNDLYEQIMLERNKHESGECKPQRFALGRHHQESRG